MFDVKNTTMTTSTSPAVQITDLRSMQLDSRGATIFATCSDGRTRQCHLYRYGVSHEERIAFAHRLLDAKKNNDFVVFEAFGGFDSKRWFGEFKVVEVTEDTLDVALREEFQKLLNS